MTGYAVEFRIPTEHFMSSLTKVSSTTRVRHRAWIRRYARGVWRAAVDAGAYHLDRFMCLVGIQWPGESIYGPAAALETAKPIIDAATDTCDPQGRHLLIEDDDPSHRVMTAYYTVPGTSACGVTLYASMIPLSPEERMPSGVVNRFEAGALKGYTAKVSIPDGTWMTSNHRLDPEERKLRMEKTMALSYDISILAKERSGLFLCLLLGFGRGSGGRPSEHERLADAVALPGELEQASMMHDPVDDRGRELVVREDRAPFAGPDVRGGRDAPPLVAARDDPVEQARPVDVERHVAELVQDDRVGPADVPGHRVEVPVSFGLAECVCSIEVRPMQRNYSVRKSGRN